MRDLFSDDFKAAPYWWDRTPRPAPEAVVLPAKTDVLVIGSGYTGLNAALVTARAGRDTLVLDARDIGHGCSSRNGGQISTSVKGEFDELAKSFGPKAAFALHQCGFDALEWIEDFVTSEKIDCAFKVCGKFHAAHNPARFEAMKREVEDEHPNLRTNAEIIERNDQHREIGSNAYYGGILYPHQASLDPARYHEGLARQARSAGANLIGHCAVTGIRREGAEFEVQTVSGIVRAREIVIATNGYTSPATPWLRRRIIPIGSYMIATDLLPETLIDDVIPNDRIVTDSRRVIYYYRASPDRRRILFGGRVSIGETDVRSSGPKLHAEMVRLFPQLAASQISHSWMGFVAFTFDTLPHAGKAEGMHYAAGYCGSGISLASYFGMKIGRRITGAADSDLPTDEINFPTRPLYSGNPWFLAPSVAVYRLLDRLNY